MELLDIYNSKILHCFLVTRHTDIGHSASLFYF